MTIPGVEGPGATARSGASGVDDEVLPALLKHSLTLWAPPLGAAVLALVLLVAPGAPAVTAAHRSELGIGYLKLQDSRAEATLRSALAMDPQQVRANHALGLLLSDRGKHDEAIAALSRAREAAGPGELEPALALAVAQQRAGAHAAALSLYTELHRRFPEDARLPFNLAMLALKQGDKPAARTWLRTYMGLSTSDLVQLRDARATLERLEAELASPADKLKKGQQ